MGMMSLRLAPNTPQPRAETLIHACSRIQEGLPIEIKRTAVGPNSVTVNLLAYTISGHNRIYDYNVPEYLKPSQDASNVYRSRTSITYSGTSTAWWRLNALSSDNTASLCFPDDRLITGESMIRVVLMGGSGYTVNPDMAAVDVRINDDASDACDNPDGIMNSGGIIYKVLNGNLNDMCVCANQSKVVATGIADGEEESYATTALKWRTDSTDYCPNSPCQRPGG